MANVEGADAVAGPGRALHAALWLAQLLLAVAFGSAGFLKLTQPIPQLIEMMGWPGALPEPMVRFIGAAELAAGLGLILPAATRIQPKLTPLAAAGLTLIMALAVGFHLSRGEMEALPINLVLGGLAAFVLWGRLVRAPIAPKR